jgi:hypothetical protein
MKIDKKDITTTIPINDIDYEVTYDYWKWTSIDRMEPDEEEINITEIIPATNEEIEKEIYTNLWKIYGGE